MRPRLPLIVLAVTVLAGSAHADALEEIRRLDNEISVATWSADAVWFEENLAGDYVLITPGGAARTKRDVIRELATPGLKMEPYEPQDVNVRLYGDTAVVIGRMIQRFTLGGVQYAKDVRYTNVYVKRKSKWLLVTAHTSVVSPRR